MMHGYGYEYRYQYGTSMGIQHLKKKSKIWYVGDTAINSYLFLGIFKYFCT